MPSVRPRYLIASLAGLLLAAYCVHAAPPDAGLLTAEVRKADIEQTVIATGSLEAYKQVSVGAQVSGQITKLHVDFGDVVKQGDLIAEIDTLTQQDNLAARQHYAQQQAMREQALASVHDAERIYRVRYQAGAEILQSWRRPRRPAAVRRSAWRRTASTSCLTKSTWARPWAVRPSRQ